MVLAGSCILSLEIHCVCQTWFEFAVMVEIRFSILLEIPDKCCLCFRNCSCKDLKKRSLICSMSISNLVNLLCRLSLKSAPSSNGFCSHVDCLCIAVDMCWTHDSIETTILSF